MLHYTVLYTENVLYKSRGPPVLLNPYLYPTNATGPQGLAGGRVAAVGKPEPRGAQCLSSGVHALPASRLAWK